GLPFHQQVAQPHQDPLLRQHRLLGRGETAGEGSLQLAAGHRGRPPQARAQAHRAGHAHRRHRPARRAATALVRTTINIVINPSTGTPRASLVTIETPEHQIAKLTGENRLLAAEIDALQAELDVQKGIVAALLKRLYGAKSEKMSQDQLLMAFL